MYSAATMAVAYALIERLMVEITVAPLDTVNADKDLQNSAGSATCSITWKLGTYSAFWRQIVTHKKKLELGNATFNGENVILIDNVLYFFWTKWYGKYGLVPSYL